MLAGLDQAALERLLGHVTLERFTNNTLTDKAALYRRLQTIRDNGYGTDEEEYTIGVRCVAVPIRDLRGEVIAAMSVSVPVIRFDEESSTRALALLFEASSGLSAALGYQDRQAPVGQAWAGPPGASPLRDLAEPSERLQPRYRRSPVSRIRQEHEVAIIPGRLPGDPGAQSFQSAWNISSTGS